MKVLSLMVIAAISTMVLGGCGGGRILSVDMTNDTDHSVQMQVREGKGADNDPALVTAVVKRTEHLTWSGKSAGDTYFRAVRLENDQPAGNAVDLPLVAGATTSATVKFVDGQLKVTQAAVRRVREERPEDVVPPPDRLPSGHNPRY